MKYLDYEELYDEGDETGAVVDAEDIGNGTEAEEPSGGGAGSSSSGSITSKVSGAKNKIQNLKKIGEAIKKLSTSGPLLTILFWVFVVIVVLIIIIGILMFLVTMPGMAMEKLSAFFKEVGNTVAAFFGADTTTQVSEDQIYSTLDYLDQMGYDLKAEGFLTHYYTQEEVDLMTDGVGSNDGDLPALTTAELEEGYSYDEKNGVIRNTADNIIRAESDFIFTYMVSDNYIYTIKNDNLVYQDAYTNILNAFVNGVDALLEKGLTAIFSFLADDVIKNKGNGMLVFWYDDGIGNVKNIVRTGSFWDANEISIDVAANKLKIKKGEWFKSYKAIEYDLDGWSGRYGMPLEFLLSIHKATLMPDLAYDMANSFKTNVNIYLHEIKGNMVPIYKSTESGDINVLELISKVENIKSQQWFKTLKDNYWNGIFDSTDDDIANLQAAIDSGVNVGNPETIDEYTCTCYEETYYLEYNDLHELYKNPTDGKYYVKAGENIPYWDLPNVPTLSEEAAESETETEPETETPAPSPTPTGLVAGDLYDYDPNIYVHKYIIKRPCDNCKTKVNAIIALSSQADEYKAYNPYIAYVNDHWYRDVYFIDSVDDTEGSVDTGNKNFVKYDYEYEARTKERWTLYETYTNNSSDGDLYKPEWNGEFVLYVVDENGEYQKDEYGNYIIYDGTLAHYEAEQEERRRREEQGEVIEEEEIKVAKKAVTMTAADTEQLKDLGWTAPSGETTKWTAYYANSEPNEETTPIYTPDQIQAEANDIIRDVKNKGYLKIITYENIVQTGEGLRTETNPEIKKMFLQNNYFAYTGEESDAEVILELREKIYEKRVNDLGAETAIKYGPLSDEEVKYGLTTEGNLVENARETTESDSIEHYVSDYVGQVGDVINQTSLNAFTMLENTHTLDADYIYRDFKELIVELGYFEKEELTEDPPRVLQFLVPDVGSAGYPDTTIDKRENEQAYTMIHSKGDIEANKKYTLKALVQQLGDEVAEENAGSGNTENGSAETNGIPAGNPDTNIAQAVSGARLSMTLNSNINIAEVGAVNTAIKTPSQVSLKEFLDTTREMCEYINSAGYDYCVLRRSPECTTCSTTCKESWETNRKCLKHTDDCSCTEVHCNHAVWGAENECRLSTTFEASKQSTTTHNFCCGTLVSWSLQNVGVMPDEDHLDGAETLASYCLDKLGGKKIERGQALKEGDILCYEGHIDLVGKKVSGGFEKYNGGHYTPIGATPYGGNSCIEFIDGWPSNALYAVRLSWGQNEDKPYVGYEGNEAVVSPVTGILLEYGTYNENPDEPHIDVELDKEYRVNVDLRYGPSIKLTTDSEADTTGETAGEGETPTPTEDTENATEFESRLVSDQVGYAKILVLDKENYEKLETLTNNKWKTYNSNQGLLTNNGVFEDEISTEEEYESFQNSYSNPGDALFSETIYGYKEFAEAYEDYGISGYEIYIDGFKCELPDPDFVDTNEDGSIADETGKPQGTVLTMNSFKMTESQIKNLTENENIQSRYEAPEAHKLISASATEKLNLEEAIKINAAPAVTIQAPSDEDASVMEDLIFIKEGTIIGRTLTDRELIEDIRSDEEEEIYNYSDYRVVEEEIEEGEEENKDMVAGNYLRISMRSVGKSVEDSNDSSVENIEDYMKLDEPVEEMELDYEFFFWSPYEGGAWGTFDEYVTNYTDTGDDVGQGPTIIAVNNDPGVTWSLAVGIAQWTNNSGGLNNISGLCSYLSEFDPLLAPLGDYAGKNAQFFYDNLASFKETWHGICSTQEGYDKMLEGQMTYAYEKEWLDSESSYYRSISEWAKERPMALQGFIFSVMNWGNYTLPSGGKLLDPVEESKDDLTILKELAKNCLDYANSKSLTVDRWDSQAQLCKDLMEDIISEEQLEEWIQTKNIEGVSPGYAEGVEYDEWK